MRPDTSPRHPRVSASTASIACSNKPRPTPLPISPKPRRRSAVVRKLNSLVSWIARICRPAQTAAACSPQPSIRCSTVTRGFARNRPKRTISRRRPPANRRRHTLLRPTMRSSSSAPLFPDAGHQTGPAPSIPSPLLLDRPTPSKRITATRRWESPPHLNQQRSVHPLARVRGNHDRALSRMQPQGLSPRVRGNRIEGASTPGQPGLSPRVRGNLTARRQQTHFGGSIPARAGEPPRVRGNLG